MTISIPYIRILGGARNLKPISITAALLLYITGTVYFCISKALLLYQATNYITNYPRDNEVVH